jgi:excisionase family DNA binding protein
MTSKWVNVTEACQSLGISESTLRRHIDQGKIESKKEYGRRLILIETDNHMISTVTEADMISQLRSELEHLREENQFLRQKLDDAEESRQRQDTITLQLTRQLEQSQRLLEYHQEPWYRRWFRKG